MDPTPPVNAHRLNPVDGWLRRLSLHLLPPRCLLCGGPGMAGRELCAPCAADLPWNRSQCAQCALPLVASTEHCGECQQHPPAFDRLVAPLRYAYLLGDALAKRLADAATRPDLLVPVPLHAQRLRERGYNQSLELARRLAPAIGLRIDAAALARARATAAQSELDAAARRRNVRDAFVADPARVRDRHIALIDDVATTAATAHECARALKLAGARDGSVYVIPRAPARHD